MKLKPFDLEAAKAGASVVTREGTPARIICFDRISNSQMVALIKNATGDEDVCTYTLNGEYINGYESSFDLFMAPKIITKFVTVSRIGKKIVLGSKLFDTQEDVDKYGKYLTEYRVGIAKVEWEE